jgi:hypothetical protein
MRDNKPEIQSACGNSHRFHCMLFCFAALPVPVTYYHWPASPDHPAPALRLHTASGILGAAGTAIHIWGD